jgi:hypothetical protein
VIKHSRYGSKEEIHRERDADGTREETGRARNSGTKQEEKKKKRKKPPRSDAPCRDCLKLGPNNVQLLVCEND